MGVLNWDVDATQFPFNIAMDPERGKVYLSKLWVVSNIFTAVANNAFAELALITPREVQVSALVGAGGDAYVYLHSGVSASGGSAPTVTNAHLVPAGSQQRPVPWTSVLAGPTVTQPGTKIFESFAPGGQGGNAVGVIAGKIVEYHLTPDGYNFRVQNKAGQAKDISITLYIVEL